MSAQQNRRDPIFVADGPAGPLYAGVCPTVRFTEARVADYRLGAALAPYSSEAAARAALEAEGGRNVREMIR